MKELTSSGAFDKNFKLFDQQFPATSQARSNGRAQCPIKGGLVGEVRESLLVYAPACVDIKIASAQVLWGAQTRVLCLYFVIWKLEFGGSQPKVNIDIYCCFVVSHLHSQLISK